MCLMFSNAAFGCRLTFYIKINADINCDEMKFILILVLSGSELLHLAFRFIKMAGNVSIPFEMFSPFYKLNVFTGIKHKCFSKLVIGKASFKSSFNSPFSMYQVRSVTVVIYFITLVTYLLLFVYCICYCL